jgi:hypothetical protein
LLVHEGLNHLFNAAFRNSLLLVDEAIEYFG